MTDVTRTNTGHGVFTLFTTYSGGYEHGVAASSNTIVNPASGPGVKAWGLDASHDVKASFAATVLQGVAVPYSVGAYASVSWSP